MNINRFLVCSITFQYYLTYCNLVVNGVTPLLLLLFLNLKIYSR